MRVGLVQLRSGEDRNANLERIAEAVRQAAASGCELVALPEACTYRGPFAADLVEDLGGPVLSRIGALAAEHGIRVLVGGIWLRSPRPDRPYNSAVLIDRDGQPVAVYRKVHLFQIDDDDVVEQESAFTSPGDELVAVGCGEHTLGLSICYDLRFPEVYRNLVDVGATVLCVPANFAVRTGRSHWEALLRARAIENLSYVVAPAQIGPDSTGFEAYGHSMVVDPWGTVLATAADDELLITADLSGKRVADCRSTLPALGDVRPDVYAKPVRGEQYGE
ncbi:carbon-nitrogen hydrolase family protein [Streptomyces sp.]|uniref:carbon-nitrogen hydrolase family protein n=1 Tax=Streptomyces sp. TaxID=1931 RepID=UPI002F42C0C8